MPTVVGVDGYQDPQFSGGVVGPWAACGRAGAFEPMVANDGWAESRCQGRQPPKGGGRRPAFTAALRPAIFAPRIDGMDAEFRRCGCPRCPAWQPCQRGSAELAAGYLDSRDALYAFARAVQTVPKIGSLPHPVFTPASSA